ncbi:MAG TPA: hypothetical protein VGL23_16100, partial [Chloroflexota bacterium]
GIARPDVVYLMQMVGLETWLRTFHLPRARLVTTATQSVARVPEARSDPADGRSDPLLVATARRAPSGA